MRASSSGSFRASRSSGSPRSSRARALALAACSTLIRIASAIVPAAARREWRDEWLAEVACHAPVIAPLSLLARTAGCVPHAIWLRKEDWSLEMLWQDIRYALRTLRRRPGFTLLSTLTLALAVGALTAVFSLVYTVLLKPLPYREPDRLVQIWEYNPLKGWTNNVVAPANLLDWQERTRTIGSFAAHFMWEQTFTIGSDDGPDTAKGLTTSANLFEVLGASAARGRTFAAGEDLPGHQTIVLTDAFWRRRFGGQEKIVGQTVTVNGSAREIVGVMPPGFAYPSPDVDFYMGYGLPPEWMRKTRRAHLLRVIARLKPGVTIPEARADLRRIASQLEREYPDTNTQMGADLGPQQEWVVGASRQKLLLFLGAVVLVLLIACSNVASLLLAQGVERSREFALRTALGARRGRLVRQLLTEGLVLSSLGGLLGVIIMTWLVRLFIAFSPGDVPRLDEVRVDARLLLFSAAVSMATVLLFGLAPALRTTPRDPASALREGGRGGTAGPLGTRMRRFLVIGEVALAVLLVTGAGLLIRSFSRLQQVDPGITRERVLSFELTLSGARYGEPQSVVTFYDRFFPALAAIPGVRAVAATTDLPFKGPGWTGDSTIEGRPPHDFIANVGHKTVTSNYFATVGLTLLRGRTFQASDTREAEPVVVVNDTLARRYFAGEDPIGHRLTFAKPSIPGKWYRIAGVVEDERLEGLDVAVTPIIYVPTTQNLLPQLRYVLRTDLPADAIVPQVRSVLRKMDDGLAIESLGSLDELMAKTTSPARFTMQLMTTFAALALLLAVIGIYGVVSYGVSQRTQEIGVRMALGAGRSEVRRMVMSDALRPVLTGLAIGLTMAYGATRVLEHQLFEVSPTDPITFTLVPALLIAVALIASYVPARRATRIDPIEALRLD
jgi:putative ABC transport system permease protein